METKGRTNIDFEQALLEALPDAIVWMRPVINTSGDVEDFEVGYANRKAKEEHSLYAKGSYVGLRVKRDGLPNSVIAEDNFRNYLEIWKTGETRDFSFHVPHLSGAYDIQRSIFKGGVLSIYRDKTKQREALEALRKEAQFSTSILNASLNGIYVVEACWNDSLNITDFTIVQGNKRFEELTGISMQDVKGKSMLSLFPKTRHSGLYEMFCRVLHNEENYQNEPYFAESFNKWYEYSIVRLGENKLVITFQDITEQKTAALQIEHQENLLNNLLRFSPAGITVTEVIRNQEGKIIDGRTILNNDAAEKFTGIPDSVSKTRTIAELDPALLESPLYQMALSTLESGKPFSTIYYFEPTGRWLELSVSKMDDDHLINVFLDITPQREAQLQQEKLLQELRRTNADLEEFSYASSHDLKEPIRKILIFSDRLQDKLSGRIDEEESRILDRLHHTASRMQVLVEDLLMYSQVNQKSALDEWVDLNAKLKLVMQDLEMVIEEKGATIHAGNLPLVKGHRRQLQQLLHNLLSNSLKYSKPGVPPEITITCRVLNEIPLEFGIISEAQGREYYLLEFRDNGIGFEAKNAEQIFQVFQRLHTKSEYPGNGIGLAIARRVVEHHGGFIAARSTPGEGATFLVMLPVHKQ